MYLYSIGLHYVAVNYKQFKYTSIISQTSKSNFEAKSIRLGKPKSS